MNIQSPPNDSQVKIEQRIRTIRTLWTALFLSVGAYYVFTLLSGLERNINPNKTLSLILLALGLLAIVVSFPIKKAFLTKSVEQQRVDLVQQGYVVTWAVVEVAALLGLIDFFATGNRYYYLLFIVAACGQLLHFPKRQHVIDASFKSPTLR
jgi:predicted transporter